MSTHQDDDAAPDNAASDSAAPGNAPIDNAEHEGAGESPAIANAAHQQLLDNLVRHVFGDGEPSSQLLNEGTFPANWVSRYERFVQSANRVWGHQNTWPKNLVGAVHFASLYLESRYAAWQTNGLKREQTEEGLRRVRGVSEVFLIGSVVPHLTLDEDGDRR